MESDPAALTIVARRPSTMALDDLSPPDGDELDGPTENLMRLLRPLGSTNSRNTIRRATTLRNVIDILTATRPAGLIQIVGHGMPGILKLGETWHHPKDASIYRIDADINRYGILRRLITPQNRVRFLGCTTGKGSTSTVEDGPALIFTFARLWQAEVAAPDEVFDESDFSSDGIFASTDKLVFALPHELRVSKGTPGHRTPPPDGPSTTLQFERLLAAPMFERAMGTLAAAPPPVPPQLEQLSRAPFVSTSLKGAFAAAELVFDVRWNDELWTCELLGGQTLLRLQREGQPATFLIPSSEAATHFSALIGDLVSRIYTL